ncbi:MAG: TetR/AcrR family transcriptional regulator [Acidimicrobiaceae bacterium]|nr:TetR/AcrR family transcriptional regulator [Acidimicrobiaceae bacterium]
MNTVLDAVAERLILSDESQIRIPEICEVTGVNYGSVYHHFGSREGVIEAAYEKIFSQLVDEDIEALSKVSTTVETFDDFVEAVAPLVELVSSGKKRRSRRALRLRIVAAAQTRPALKSAIGDAQVRLTDRLSDVIGYGQEHGWLRSDLSAHTIAVVMQVLIFGRNLDDVASAPIDDGDWEVAMGVAFSGMVRSR